MVLVAGSGLDSHETYDMKNQKYLLSKVVEIIFLFDEKSWQTMEQTSQDNIHNLDSF